jgi:hypothetical protein
MPYRGEILEKTERTAHIRHFFYDFGKVINNCKNRWVEKILGD